MIEAHCLSLTKPIYSASPLGRQNGLRQRSSHRFLPCNRNANPMNLVRSTSNAIGASRGPIDNVAAVPQPIADLADEELSGPVELPPQVVEIDPYALPEANLLQTAASIVLTGAITLLLVRSLRRRSKRAKEVRFRSNAVERLNGPAKEKPPAPVLPPTEPPSAFSTFGGALVAGAIAVVLYKFTSGIEDTLSSQPVSANYSIRNITVTVRTIVTGICWLATFVFAANSLGLGLYSIQIALGLASTETSSQGGTAPDAQEKEEGLSKKDTE